VKNYTKNGPTRPKTCEVCQHYTPITKGRGTCQRRVENGGTGATLRVKTCPFFKPQRKSDQTLIFDLSSSSEEIKSDGSKDQMIVAIREAEEEMIVRTDNEILRLKNQIAELISSRENYRLGVEAAINAIKTAK